VSVRVYILLGCLGAFLAVVGVYLFRVEVLEAGYLGEVSVKYKWGYPAELRQDLDEDGSNDLVERLDAPFGRYAAHTTLVTEGFYDTDFEGQLDAHVIFQGEGGAIKVVELDRDGDGVFEVLLRGEEAQEENEKMLWGFTRTGKEESTPIAGASLAVSAPDGVVEGTFRLRFLASARVYYPEDFGLAAATNRWFFVKIESETAAFHLQADGIVPRWPHRDSVRIFEPGEETVVALQTGEGAPFSLHSDYGRHYRRLPPGSYRVTAKFVVPDYRYARRLDLTSFEVKAGPVELVVATDNGVE